MPILYIDNFRGFKDTFLSLEKVNFFVGENSTGKTSILKLIKILSDSQFWTSLEFANQEADLGYFSEIASDPKKAFEVGIIDDIDKKEKLSAFKFKFVERDNLPVISELRYIDSGVNIEVLIEGSSAKYRYAPIESKIVTEASKQEFFIQWINSNYCENQEYKDLKLPIFPSVSAAFLIMRYNISKEIGAEDNHDFTLSPFTNEMAWLAPIRTEPKRTYDSYKTSFHPDGTHAPYVLKSLLKNKKGAKSVERILQKFGKDSGLFDEIKIKSLGKTQTSPFEIYISINGAPQKITNVGYGVSQILPLIIEVISRARFTWFAIQQPEIHLHPRGQAAFGEFLYKSFIIENKNFIVETHSDYTIDRFRLRVNRDFNGKTKKTISSQIVFFHRVNKGNSLTCIPILPDGSLPSEQPEEFRNFFIKEQLELLKI